MKLKLIPSLILVLAFGVGVHAEEAEREPAKAKVEGPKIDAEKLVKQAEDQTLGNSFHGKLHMTIERPDSKRELDILSWSEAHKKSVVKILKPEKDKGTANLRLDYDLWQYLPKVERLIKIPPSLMLQSWMGSDFTNDDLVKTSSFVRDYTHEFVGYGTIDGQKVAKIICHPKPNAPVVWGKLEMWIEPNKASILQEDFYTETGEVLKRLKGSNVKTFGTHTIPSKLSMTTVKKNTTTTLEYIDAHFDDNIKKDIFTQSFLKSPMTSL